MSALLRELRLLARDRAALALLAAASSAHNSPHWPTPIGASARQSQRSRPTGDRRPTTPST
jgi:hypothetical protein